MFKCRMTLEAEVGQRRPEPSLTFPQDDTGAEASCFQGIKA